MRTSENKQKTNNKMPYLSSKISIITLNVSGLNKTIKRQGLAESLQKHDPTICCLQETYSKFNNRHGLKAKRWKKIYHGSIKNRQKWLYEYKTKKTSKQIKPQKIKREIT